MKLDNMTNEKNNMDNNYFDAKNNSESKFDPDRFLDEEDGFENNFLNDKMEIDVKITERIEFNPDNFKDIGNGKQNKEDGSRREKEVYDELEKKYPESEGYQILQERYLLDKDGNIVKDRDGCGRRVDFVVVQDGKVVDMVEVTSLDATKNSQMRKEYEIRENGGNYIKDPNSGELYRIPNNINTRIERRE